MQFSLPFPLSIMFLGGAVAVMAPASGQQSAPDSSYILRSNDAVRMDIYGEPELATSVRIVKSGEATFPLIGSIKIGGLSIAQATEKLRAAYDADYLVDPKLTLTVQGYATQYIAVIGAVRSPGQIPLPESGGLDLATAMATCGGVTELADQNRVQLVRANGGSTLYSVQAITTGEAGRVKLAAGDRIIVNQSAYVGKTVTVLGQVRKQGPLPFPPDGKLDLVQAVAMAGGLTDLANPKKVSLNRGGRITQINYKEISEQGTTPFMLRPDDIIVVAERLF